jgi:protein tyrosine phosphatase
MFTLADRSYDDDPSSSPTSGRSARSASGSFSSTESADTAATDLSKSDQPSVLVVDIRPCAQYLANRINTAINVCIPSTLLKRPAYVLARFIECMFPSQKDKLANISNYDYVVIYDESTMDTTAGPPALLHTLLKFNNAPELSGKLRYLQGGFSSFEAECPQLTDKSPVETSTPVLQHQKPRSSELMADPKPPGPLPVLTGFRLPENCTKYSVKSSFENYDYVETSVPVSFPQGLTKAQIDRFPEWLQSITSEEGPRLVAERFHELEQAEKSRLESAFSRDRAFSTPSVVDEDGNLQYSISAGVEFGYKNRYNNIWPYDHSRVILAKSDNATCDYINASYISTNMTSKRYIATQAPLPETFKDFWRVIWDKQIPVIVMLTAESEGGRVKCHLYWQDGQYGDLILRAIDEEEIQLGRGGTKVTLRRFRLENVRSKKQHTVVQIHYTEWPDLGSPASAEDLLALCLLKDKIVDEWKYTVDDTSGPTTMVHCSAGCGRTGTFCAVDSTIDVLRKQLTNGSDGEDIIFKLVDKFRTQRKSMVQSIRQYALCYEAAILWCSNNC